MTLPVDTYLSVDDLNKFFQTLTLSILGYDSEVTAWEAYLISIGAGHTWTDPIPANPYKKVRISWLTSGEPSWLITDNVCFIRAVEADDPINRQREISESLLVISEIDWDNFAFRYTRVINVFWNLYGPNSFDNAQKIRDGMFYPTYQETLSKNNLKLVPTTKSPVRLPELFQGQWWERTDISMIFNSLTVKNVQVPYAEAADIIIEDYNGIVKEISIIEP